MKKTFLFSLLLVFSFVFNNCKKKSTDPSPSNPKPVSVWLSSGGVTKNYPIVWSDSVAYYEISGSDTTGTYRSLFVRFLNGRPTVSASYPYSRNPNQAIIYITDSQGISYVPEVGPSLINVQVNGTSVTVSFTNVTFTESNNTLPCFVASGYLYSPI